VHEPPHVHVIHGGIMAKVWLKPVETEYNRGYHRAELNRVLKLTEHNQARFIRGVE
jgi:hypothetical protein